MTSYWDYRPRGEGGIKYIKIRPPPPPSKLIFGTVLQKYLLLYRQCTKTGHLHSIYSEWAKREVQYSR